MVEFNKGFHASLIQEDSWQRILKSCDFLEDVDQEATRFELGDFKRRYDEVYTAQGGNEDQLRFTYTQQRNMLREVHDFARNKGNELDNFSP
jgi:hypothetical protein